MDEQIPQRQFFPSFEAHAMSEPMVVIGVEIPGMHINMGVVSSRTQTLFCWFGSIMFPLLLLTSL